MVFRELSLRVPELSQRQLMPEAQPVRLDPRFYRRTPAAEPSEFGGIAAAPLRNSIHPSMVNTNI